MPKKLWMIVLSVVAASAVVLGSLYILGYLSGNGTLAVEVHDAPCSGCTHVWVSFSSVAAHESDMTGSGWTTLSVSNATIDLMALNGSAFAKVIGVDTLKAGHYEQIRISVSKVAVTLVGGANISAYVPTADSGDVNGAFDIASGGSTTISIDIDLASSLHVTDGGAMVNATFTPNVGSVVVV